MVVFVQTYLMQVIHGLAYGMLLFLVASGFTLVYGMKALMGVLEEEEEKKSERRP